LSWQVEPANEYYMAQAQPHTGVLLVNLGTPDSTSTKDVRTYLREFLMDGRVVDIPKPIRWFLVNSIIAPFRAPKSAAEYRKLWTDRGSPLKFFGYDVRDGLQKNLGQDFQVELAMRYQNPSIAEGLAALQEAKVGRIIVIPLFPQYASATNGSVADKVMEITRTWQVVPSIQFINQFPDHPSVIETFAERAQPHMQHEWDHVLFSYHGLPERQIRKASTGYCQLSDKCCSQYGPQNQYCYRAQCFLTSRKIAEALNIPEEKYTVTFQSRLGSDPWVKPYTDDTMRALADTGAKRLLVFSPAFVADCLETNIELGEALKGDFEELGGEHLQLVESLNDHPRWIAGLQEMVMATLAPAEAETQPA